MRALLIAVCIALVAIVYSAASATQVDSRGPTRIAFVSPKRLLVEVPELRAEVSRFQTAQQQRVNELRSKQRALAETRRKLAQAGVGSTREALQKQEAEQEAELQRAASEAQSGLQASQHEVQQALQAQLRPVLEQLARNQNINAFLNADTSALWSSRDLDVTTTVIQELNASNGTPKKP